MKEKQKKCRPILESCCLMELTSKTAHAGHTRALNTECDSQMTWIMAFMFMCTCAHNKDDIKQKKTTWYVDLIYLSASQTLRVSIITIYSVHSSKVCRPVAGGGATVAPFYVKWRHHGATLTGNLILTCLALWISKFHPTVQKIG